MQARRYLIAAIVLLSLALIGCSKSAKAPSSENQPPASQNSANPAAIPGSPARGMPCAAAI